MNSSSISVNEALELLKRGKTLKGYSIAFGNVKLKETLTVNIEVDHNVNAWLQKNDIELDHLLEKLIHDFYSAHQLIRSR